MSSRFASPSVLCGFALLGGLLQIGASIQLGLARSDRLQAAALEGSTYYVLGAFAAALGLCVVWFLRRRPAVAVVALLLWQAAVLWPLSARTTSLGLSYHGDYILHHFTAIVSCAAVVTIARQWWSRAELGGARKAVAAIAVAAALLLLVVHLWSEPSVGGEPPTGLRHLGVALALGAWATAIAALWPRLGPMRMRVVTVALLLPFVLRVAFAWPEGLAGASVFDIGRPWVMTAMVVSALLTYALFRPAMPRPYIALVSALAGILVLIFYVAYKHRFGDYEAGLGGLVQTMFAFTPPYPTYVPTWKVLAVLLGIFGIVSAAYAGMVTPGERVRGVAIALLLAAGLGLGSPALALMTLAAALTWIDAATADPEMLLSTVPAPLPVEQTLDAVADALALPAAVVLETEQGTMVAIAGELEGAAVDLRARPVRREGKEQWHVELRVGVLGRDRATVELLPGSAEGASRPAHALSDTHRARGSSRDLEQVADSLLDALLPFSTARTELWPDGARVRFGGDLGAFDCAHVSAVIRGLCRRR